jgi:hypothetical protein
LLQHPYANYVVYAALQNSKVNNTWTKIAFTRDHTILTATDSTIFETVYFPGLSSLCTDERDPASCGTAQNQSILQEDLLSSFAEEVMTWWGIFIM